MRRCVSGIIMNDNDEVLIQNHTKLQRYTLPGGKVDPGEADKDAIVREMFEELGILIYRYGEIMTATFSNVEYPANSGDRFDFNQTFYKIDNYSGEITNKEPEKHPELLWVKPEHIRELGPLSVVLNRYLEYKGL